jgi:hypothetical protein
VRAYPLQAVTSRQGTQTIYVIVQDQRLLPVENVQITLTLRMPSGEEMRFIVPNRTNERGVTQYSFGFMSENVGIVQVYVSATRDSLESTTSSSFRVWW